MIRADRGAYRFVLLLTAVSILSGCSWHGAESTGRMRPTGLLSRRPVRVHEIHVAWNDALMELAGKPHMRGFAARVYLFEADNPEPVLARGTFTFFAWVEPEEQGQAKVQPDRTWVFSPSEAERMVHKDAFGWGYSFWLPWGPAEEPTLKCNLRASFRADDGIVLVSDPATVTLPGPSKPLAEYRTLQRLTGNHATSAEGPVGETLSDELPASLLRGRGRSTTPAP